MALSDVQRRDNLTTTEIRRDVQDEVFRFLQNYPFGNVVLQGLYNMQPEVTAREHKHEWVDDQISEISTTLTGNISSHNASATGITINVADSSIFRAQDRVEVNNLQPIYEVTDIPTGTSITVKEVRGVALGSDAGNGAKATLTRANDEISEYSDLAFEGARIGDFNHNFTQIFRQNVQVSRSEQEIARLGGIYTESDIWMNASERAFEKIAWQFYRAITRGVRQERTASAFGYMGGFREYVDVSGGNVIDASGAALSVDLMDQVSELVYDDMGSLDDIVLVMQTKQAKKLADLEVNRLQYNDPQPTRAVGQNVAMYVPDISGSNGINVIVDPNMPQNEIWVVNPDKTFVAALGSETFNLIEETTPGTTARQGYVYGEYTYVVRNGKHSHGIIKDLSV